jgi:multidrug resistance efflux pump
MASPVRKRVTDEVMQRVSDAIDQMHTDPGARRTKRELERLTGLGHDAVARAFRRDTAEQSRWNLTARFAALTDPEAGRRSPQEQQVHELRLKLREKNTKIAELEATLDRYAMTVLAHHLELADQSAPGGDVISLGRNRNRTRR